MIKKILAVDDPEYGHITVPVAERPIQVDKAAPSAVQELLRDLAHDAQLHLAKVTLVKKLGVQLRMEDKICTGGLNEFLAECGLGWFDDSSLDEDAAAVVAGVAAHLPMEHEVYAAGTLDASALTQLAAGARRTWDDQLASITEGIRLAVRDGELTGTLPRATIRMISGEELGVSLRGSITIRLTGVSADVSTSMSELHDALRAACEKILEDRKMRGIVYELDLSLDRELE